VRSGRIPAIQRAVSDRGSRNDLPSLARTRWPDQIPGSVGTYGTDFAVPQDLCGYWETSRLAPSKEDRFNRCRISSPT